MNLDFSGLDNDQLLALIRAAMADAVSRGVAMATAANDIYVDAQERARIEAEAALKAQERAAELERDRIRRAAEARVLEQEQKLARNQNALLWAKKKAVVQALQVWGVTEDFQVNVWSRGDDKRVYFQQLNCGRGGWDCCLYITGNSYHPPGDLEASNVSRMSEGNPLRADEQKDWDKLRAFLQLVADRWNSLKISNVDVRAVAEPYLKHYEQYCAALEIPASAEEAINV